jgi:hypothetical protein
MRFGFSTIISLENKSRKFTGGDFDEVAVAVLNSEGIWAFEFNQQYRGNGHGLAGVQTRPRSSRMRVSSFLLR